MLGSCCVLVSAVARSRVFVLVGDVCAYSMRKTVIGLRAYQLLATVGRRTSAGRRQRALTCKGQGRLKVLRPHVSPLLPYSF